MDLFSTGRYEHNRPYSHIFFVPEKDYHRVTKPKPVYLLGGRGSGKTSLLKIIDWRERMKNRSLQGCFQGDCFADKILGVYLKLPGHGLNSFDKWLRDMSDDQAAPIFGLYFDLLWLQDALIGFVELMAAGEIRLSLDGEEEILRNLGSLKRLRFLSLSESDTLIDLADKIETSRERIYHMALVREPVKTFLDEFPALEPGELGRVFASSLNGSTDWTIKACFDEADALCPQQQIFVNSVVRATQSPLSYAFSFVSQMRDLTTTIYPNLTVNLDDCEPIFLNKSTPKSFQDLVEGVASARVAALQPEWRGTISLRNIFGDISINKIAYDQLKESVSAEAKTLLDLSKEYSREVFFRDQNLNVDLGEGEMEVSLDDWVAPDNDFPIYQTYLISRGGASLPKPNSESWERRAQESAEQRKKIVAAYLSMCREFGIQPLYAGYRVALALADHSVRDMLFQLDQIFILNERDLERMCSNPLSARAQSEALEKASELKLRALPNWVRIPSERVRRLVEALGRLTERLQTQSFDGRHLRSTERGRYTIDLREFESDTFKEDRENIEEAVYAGYIQEVERTDREMKIRVHRSLAPHYRFSYRGPYYDVRLFKNDFKKITSSQDGREFERALEVIALRFDEMQTDLPLFEQGK